MIKPKLQRENANEAIELYNEIAKLDQCIGPLLNHNPIQSITVYRSSVCISGPERVYAKFKSKEFIKLTLSELKLQRQELVDKLEFINFIAPEFPKVNK